MRAGNTNNLINNDSTNFKDKSNIKTKRNKIQKKHIIWMIVWIIVAIFMIIQVYKLVMYTLGKVDREKMWLYNSVNNIVNVFVKKESKSKTEEYSLKFAGLGNIYLTSSTISSAKTGDSYNFSNGIDKVADKLGEFDIVTASLTTPVADKSLGYSSKSTYNAPVELLDTLKKLNISVVATATEHAMDKNEVGINSTIENLKKYSIQQVGINSSSDENKPVVISKNEINIGFLSYATKSNVKISNTKKYLVNILDEDKVKQDIEYLKSQNVDYIVAYLNDPNDDSILTTSGKQKQNVEMLFNDGVNVVLGTSAMVVQGQLEDQIQLDNDTTTHIYSIYSLGDLFGAYSSNDSKATVIANIEFTKKLKKNKKGETQDMVADMKVNTPIFIWTTLSTNNIKTLYIMNSEIDAYNNGSSKLSAKEYNNLSEANSRLKGLFD